MGEGEATWPATSVSLISGERDAVLIDAALTPEDAGRVVDWIRATGKNLTTIYITHGHGDHFFGLNTILDAFPSARAVTAAAVIPDARTQLRPDLMSFWNAIFPGQIPEHPVVPDALDGRWERNGKPQHLKAQAEKSLRLLGLERIELFQLHRIDPDVPLADQLGALVELQAEGKIARIGLSEVSVPEIEAARAITPIATVQNRYNLSDRSAEPVLDYCETERIGFIPWYPMATGRLARAGGPLQRIADEHAVTPAQLALAWLLQRSPVLLPIPGTSTVAHLEENVAAALIELTPDQVQQLDTMEAH